MSDHTLNVEIASGEPYLNRVTLVCSDNGGPDCADDGKAGEGCNFASWVNAVGTECMDFSAPFRFDVPVRVTWDGDEDAPLVVVSPGTRPTASPPGRTVGGDPVSDRDSETTTTEGDDMDMPTATTPGVSTTPQLLVDGVPVPRVYVYDIAGGEQAMFVTGSHAIYVPGDLVVPLALWLADLAEG